LSSSKRPFSSIFSARFHTRRIRRTETSFPFFQNFDPSLAKKNGGSNDNFDPREGRFPFFISFFKKNGAPRDDLRETRCWGGFG
jgi:hypothetical protein